MPLGELGPTENLVGFYHAQYPIFKIFFWKVPPLLENLTHSTLSNTIHPTSARAVRAQNAGTRKGGHEGTRFGRGDSRKVCSSQWPLRTVVLGWKTSTHPAGRGGTTGLSPFFGDSVDQGEGVGVRISLGRGTFLSPSSSAMCPWGVRRLETLRSKAAAPQDGETFGVTQRNSCVVMVHGGGQIVVKRVTAKHDAEDIPHWLSAVGPMAVLDGFDLL